MRAGSFGALTRALAVALAVPALIALAACAVSSERAAESPAAKSADGQATATAAAPEGAYQQPGTAAMTVDQALADIQRAEGELGVAFEALSASQGRKSPAGMPAPAATTADAAGPKTEAPQAAPRPTKEMELSAGDPCFSACRALASMTRATAHLCDLTGDADARCDSARSRLEGARERVEGSCACGPPG